MKSACDRTDIKLFNEKQNLGNFYILIPFFFVSLLYESFSVMFR